MKNFSSEQTKETARGGAAGFSLLELMIALAVTMVVSGLAVTLLTESFNMRTREDRKSDALANVRRALSTMTREITNAGYGLEGAFPTNGIVAADSDNTSIRILSNADRFQGGATPDTPTSADEDVLYRLVNDQVNGLRYIARYDVNGTTSNTTVIADRIDTFLIRYYPQKVVYTTANCDITDVLDAPGGHIVNEVSPDQATYVVVTVCVQLPPVGTPGAASYQPPSVQQLTSDVQLRNATVTAF
jgi:type II secretory pathway component PulJ